MIVQIKYYKKKITTILKIQKKLLVVLKKTLKQNQIELYSTRPLIFKNNYV